LFIYIFIFILFCEAGFEDTRIDDYSDFMISIGIIVTGMLLIYKANGGSAGKQFAERYLSILFVVGLRFTVLYTSIFIGLSGLVAYSEYECPDNWHDQIVNQLVIVIGYAALYWRIIVHVKDVADNAPA